jgi:hypothetical protein
LPLNVHKYPMKSIKQCDFNILGVLPKINIVALLSQAHILIVEVYF